MQNSRVWLIGKDALGMPAVLLKLPKDLDIRDLMPIELENLSVMHGVRCAVQLGTRSPETGRFSIVSCSGADEMRQYFLRFVETIVQSLGEDVSAVSLASAVRRLVDLFRAMRQPSLKSVRGLWAELLVISSATDVSAVAHGWHATPGDLFDFAAGLERLEVKSFTAPPRLHQFSLGQLHPPSGTKAIVISVMVRSSGTGATISDLEDEVLGAIPSDLALATRIQKLVAETLGEAWREGLRLTFDRAAALESLRWYDPERIPQVQGTNVPDGVSEVRFQSYLEDTPNLDLSRIDPSDALFNAARPR